MQQSDPDHLGPDVAILVQPVHQALTVIDDVRWAARSDRLVGCLASLGLVHWRCLLPNGLVEVVHSLTAVGAADSPPFRHQLQHSTAAQRSCLEYLGVSLVLPASTLLLLQKQQQCCGLWGSSNNFSRVVGYCFA